MWLELNLARDVKSNKKGLCSYVSQKRKYKEILTPSMNMTSKLLRTDYEILNNLLPQSLLAISIPTSSFKLKECRFSLDIMKTFFNESGESLEQVLQGSCECPRPGNVNCQVGWGSEQGDLVESVPAHCRGVALDDL